MLNSVLPALVFMVSNNPPSIDQSAESANLFLWAKSRPNIILLAQKWDPNPQGPDPHGGDPHDEQSDPSMPANKEQSANKAPRDVYGNQYPNTKEPY